MGTNHTLQHVSEQSEEKSEVRLSNLQVSPSPRLTSRFPGVQRIDCATNAPLPLPQDPQGQVRRRQTIVSSLRLDRPQL